MKTENNILKLEQLSTGYAKEKPVQQQLNFTFNSGLCGIIGINGIGKSTLLKTIAGFIPPLHGEIRLNEKNLQLLTPADRAKELAVVLTEKIQDYYLSARDVIASGRSPYTGFAGKLSTEDKEIIEHYISLCGIEHLSQKKMDQLSDGERQRCMIARALAQQTSVILLDEPTSYLDFRARFGIMQLLKEISEKEKKIILFSSHDIELVFRTAAECLVMLNQNDIKKASVAEIIQSDIPEKLLEGSDLQFDRQHFSISYKKN